MYELLYSTNSIITIFSNNLYLINVQYKFDPHQKFQTRKSYESQTNEMHPKTATQNAQIHFSAQKAHTYAMISIKNTNT